MGKETHTLPIAALTVAAVVAGCQPVEEFSVAGARQADQCRWNNIHHRGDAPMDLGAGLVMTKSSFAGYHHGDDDWAGASTHLIDCSDSSWVVVDEFGQRSDGSTRFDKRRAVNDILRSMPRGDAAQAIEFVRQRAQSRSVPFESGGAPAEYCGCAILYPELRGDKTPWTPEADEALQ